MALTDLFKPAITSLVSSITDGAANIISKLKADPTKVIEAEKELEELRISASVKVQELSNLVEQTYAAELETVNLTMREESKSEHWMQWSWRPFIGFTFCAVIINNYIIIPYCKKYGVEIIAIPDNVWSAILVILGAASAGRSFTQWQAQKNKG